GGVTAATSRWFFATFREGGWEYLNLCAFFGVFRFARMPVRRPHPVSPREKRRCTRVVLSRENFCERTCPCGSGRVQTTSSPFPLDVVFASDGSPNAHLFGDEFAQLFGSAKAESDLLCLGDLPEDALFAKTRNQVGAKPFYDCLRCARRRENAPPRI